tara:strand:- start:158 stop:574 length:417 start_codon:yes stop_codon:yes gene_type:complete
LAGVEQEWYNTLSLDELNEEQWEALCDGCGKCCLLQLRSPDNKLTPLDLACPKLDIRAMRCTDYTNRLKNVPYCVDLTPEAVKKAYWLPDTCGYRLRAEGKPLYDWHPLIAKRSDLVPKPEGPLVKLDMDAITALEKL